MIGAGNMIYKNRSEILGEYIVENNATVRLAAAEYGISKSTVHKDVTEKLKQDNRSLYIQVKNVLEQNKAERHLRGGEATKLKYSMLKEAQKSIGMAFPRKKE